MPGDYSHPGMPAALIAILTGHAGSVRRQRKGERLIKVAQRRAGRPR